MKWDHKGSKWVRFGDIVIETDCGNRVMVGSICSTAFEANKQPRVHQTTQKKEKKVPEDFALTL